VRWRREDRQQPDDRPDLGAEDWLKEFRPVRPDAFTAADRDAVRPSPRQTTAGEWDRRAEPAGNAGGRADRSSPARAWQDDGAPVRSQQYGSSRSGEGRPAPSGAPARPVQPGAPARSVPLADGSYRPHLDDDEHLAGRVLPPRTYRDDGGEHWQGRDGYRGGYPERPRPEESYRPRAGNGYPARRDDGYEGHRYDDHVRRREGGYPAPRPEGYPSYREDGYPPRREDGYPPRREDGYPPRREDGYPPRREDRHRPRPEDGYGGYRGADYAPEYPSVLDRQPAPRPAPPQLDYGSYRERPVNGQGPSIDRPDRDMPRNDRPGYDWAAPSSQRPELSALPSPGSRPERPAAASQWPGESRADLVPPGNQVAVRAEYQPADRNDDDTLTHPLPVILPGATSVPRPAHIEAPRGPFEPARPSQGPARPQSITGSVEPPPTDYPPPVPPPPRPLPPAAAAKLDQIKDLYLTAEAIGPDALDKHFDQVSSRQRELIREFFEGSEPGDAGAGRRQT
jgi:hypothetical protein